MALSHSVDQSESERRLHRAQYILTIIQASFLVLVLFCPGVILFIFTGFEGLLLPTDDIVRKLNDLMATPDAAGHTYSRTFYGAMAVLNSGVAVAFLWWFFDSIRSVRRRSLLFFAAVALLSPLGYVAGRARDFAFAAQHVDPLFFGLLMLAEIYSVALTLDMALALWRLAQATETSSLHATFERRLAAGRWSAVNKIVGLPRLPLRSPRALFAYALGFSGSIGLITAFSVAANMGGIDGKLDGILRDCKAFGPQQCLAASSGAGLQILIWFILSLIGIQVAGFMKAAAKTLGGLTVADALNFADGRFILYLRPFFVDRVILPKPRLPFFSRLVTLRPFPLRLEDELFDVADGFLPLVAIGDPKDEQRTGGGQAHREFLADANWQKVVAERLRTAEHVVVVVQETDGVMWELNEIIKGGSAEKTLFLFDPAARDPAIWARLASLVVGRFAGVGLVPRNFAFSTRPMGIFFHNGKLHEIHNDNWSATSYRTAFSYFLMQRTSKGAAHVDSPNGRRLVDSELWGKVFGRFWSRPHRIGLPIMQKAMTGSGFQNVDSLDVAPLARRIRIFWNVLRPMMIPLLGATFAFVLYSLALIFGDRSKLALIGPFLMLAPHFPLVFWLYPLGSWLCWAWIGRYGRITGTFALACFSQLPFVVMLLSPYLLALVGGVLSGRRADTDSQFKIVSLLVMVIAPLTLCAVAGLQYVFIQFSSRKIGQHLRGVSPLIAFRRLVRARRQSYRKFNLAKLPMVPLAALGAIVTFVVITLVFGTLIDTLFYVPLEVRRGMASFEEYSRTHRAVTLMRMLAEAAVFLMTLAALNWWVRFAWRSIRRRATDVLADPRYRPVVFLRSFRDEDARVATKNPFWSLLRARVRLEEVIAGQMMRLGPCVAIGVPGEWAPKLGAMRAYFADADWQAAIRSWTNRAAVSVVMAGESPSVLWELEYLIWSNRASTLLMVLPPDASLEARARRWRAVSGVFAGTRWQQGVVTADVANVLCVTFEPDGTVMTVKGWPKHQIDYEVAVQTAVTRLLVPSQAASVG